MSDWNKQKPFKKITVALNLKQAKNCKVYWIPEKSVLPPKVKVEKNYFAYFFKFITTI
jgi:hypothetical protein